MHNRFTLRKILIAGRLGITPESLSRAFAKLKDTGVEVHDLQVIVRDIDALRRVATGNRRARSAFLAASR
jgi:hypothetical protein